MKRWICLLVTICMLLCMIPAVMAADGYSDVASSAWYNESVQYVTENKLMQGVGDNRFAPDDETTRGMIVTVLYRKSGETQNFSHIFLDVFRTAWYADAAVWAFNHQIAEGYRIWEDDFQEVSGYSYKFKPNQAVTREELACFLYRYAKYAGADVSGSASLEGFADAASVSDWAEEALGWCVAEGIIQGTPAGDSLNLAPADHATRAEVAAMLMRYCQMIGQ